jgi:hypothetical protein
MVRVQHPPHAAFAAAIAAAAVLQPVLLERGVSTGIVQAVFLATRQPYRDGGRAWSEAARAVVMGKAQQKTTEEKWQSEAHAQGSGVNMYSWCVHIRGLLIARVCISEPALRCTHRLDTHLEGSSTGMTSLKSRTAQW